MTESNKQDASPAAGGNGEPVRILEIDLGRKKRVWRWLAFMGLLLGVAAALAWVFVQFGATWGLASCLVGFMVVYMLLMGRWASQNWEQKP